VSRLLHVNNTPAIIHIKTGVPRNTESESVMLEDCECKRTVLKMQTVKEKPAV